MSKIKIKNFGPIKEGYKENNGWMDIEKVTVFIGNQGSGKSTVAKVISTLTWLEKAINRGDVDKGELSAAKFYKLFDYLRVKNYFKDDTKILYEGNRLSLKYEKKNVFPEIKIKEDESYVVPKIMYVPAERNFLSTISDAYDVKGLPENLFTFAEELNKAHEKLGENLLELPFNNYKYEYVKNMDSSFVLGSDYRISLLEASSGLQSSIPLFLVSRNLSLSISDDEETLRKNMSVNQSIRMNKEISDLMLNKKINEVNKEKEIDKIRSKYYNKCFFNIVEEPEQNLFPTSQWEMLRKLLEYNNGKGNKLIITTHSPYLINYLSIAIQGEYLFEKITNSNQNLEPYLIKLDKIVPIKSLVSASDVVVYQLDEKNGSIKKLPVYEGIPSDKNYLNQSLADGNNLFDSLLEIEQSL